MQSAPTKRIDIHAHGFPESYLRKLGDLYPGEAKLTQGPHGLVAYWAGAPLPVWTGGLRIEEMDRDGVTTEILSAPPIYTRLDERTAELCSLLNDFQAERAHEAPASFRSFLHLPVHDENASRKELARFAGDRTVAGVLFGSNMGGLYPGDRTLLPIWRMIHAAGLPVFIHPLYPAGCYGAISGPVVVFPCDTTLAAASIIYAGIFDQFPGIKIILAHYGGVLPFLALRLDMGIDVAGFPPGHGQDLPQLPSSYVRALPRRHRPRVPPPGVRVRASDPRHRSPPLRLRSLLRRQPLEGAAQRLLGRAPHAGRTGQGPLEERRGAIALLLSRREPRPRIARRSRRARPGARRGARGADSARSRRGSGGACPGGRAFDMRWSLPDGHGDTSLAQGPGRSVRERWRRVHAF